MKEVEEVEEGGAEADAEAEVGSTTPMLFSSALAYSM
jgi:hypothetical protein